MLFLRLFTRAGLWLSKTKVKRNRDVTRLLWRPSVFVAWGMSFSWEQYLSPHNIHTSIQYMQVHVCTFTIPIHSCFLCHIIWIAVSLSCVVLRLPFLRPTAWVRYHAHWLHSPIPAPSHFLISVISFLPFLHLFHPIVTLFVTTFGCPSFTEACCFPFV